MIVKTTHLTALYQNGHLRYIKWGDTEILRMAYTAVRDEHWLTAEMHILEETIEQQADAFVLEIKAQYRLNALDYQAHIRIEGSADDRITFSFNGEANSNFLRNRIGICVHHPIRGYAGRPVKVENPQGEASLMAFPTLISPHQPFVNIQKMAWEMEEGIAAALTFEGDIFETEDQRNWTDGSFKTYSTPLTLPFPVSVKKGDKVAQSVVLQAQAVEDTNQPLEKTGVGRERRYAFPKIGYARSRAPLTQQHIEWLRQVPFDHYRVECFFESNWEANLDLALEEAQQIGCKLELVFILNEHLEAQWPVLARILAKTDLLGSVLLVGPRGQVAPQDLLDVWIPHFKNAFPTLPIGAGTDAFFAELNRNRPTDPQLDFVAFPVCPQVHLSDDQALVENLEAQQYTLETARHFTTKPIHITPVTLKWRNYPNPADTIDARQHTVLIANWTALSLKYLAAADSITFFETIGEKGILRDTGDSPVFEFLKQVKAFEPVSILQLWAENPLQQDTLVLENRAGEWMVVAIDFAQTN